MFKWNPVWTSNEYFVDISWLFKLIGENRVKQIRIQDKSFYYCVQKNINDTVTRCWEYMSIETLFTDSIKHTPCE